MTIIEDRAAELEKIELKPGSHSKQDAFCVMELVAYVAGEPWSDHPECACPALTAFAMPWNDSLNDRDRQKLKPYVLRLVGTRSTPDVESRRSWLACDWLVRTFTPAWLRLTGLTSDADALAGLPELTSKELVEVALPVIEKAKGSGDAARDAAWDAARAAAGDAAWAAAGAAAGDAAWAAAGAAARAAQANHFRIIFGTTEMELENMDGKRLRHIERHRMLWDHFDELMADFISQTERMPSKTTLLELAEWASDQIKNPTDRG